VKKESSNTPQTFCISVTLSTVKEKKVGENYSENILVFSKKNPVKKKRLKENFSTSLPQHTVLKVVKFVNLFWKLKRKKN